MLASALQLTLELTQKPPEQVVRSDVPRDRTLRSQKCAVQPSMCTELQPTLRSMTLDRLAGFKCIIEGALDTRYEG
jgi:hypothetical protein